VGSLALTVLIRGAILTPVSVVVDCQRRVVENRPGLVTEEEAVTASGNRLTRGR
jgi:hypothetical protein